MSKEAVRVRVRLGGGYGIETYRYGAEPGPGVEVLMLLNGGPGLPCEYLREPHARLADEGWSVIAYDQLGCGASDRPTDPALWTLQRYVGELDEVRSALGIGRMHLLGHSWGTWLGTEYCLTYPDVVQTWTCADGACDIPYLVAELHRLRSALGHETVAMMKRREVESSIAHPEYQAAITLLNYRHVCRLENWPEPLTRSLSDWNMGPYTTMQGPNEFTYTGNMKDWNRIPALHALRIPSLVLCGAYDELTPACSMKIHNALPDSTLHVFEASSHMPFYEEPDAYFAVLREFLATHPMSHRN